MLWLIYGRVTKKTQEISKEDADTIFAALKSTIISVNNEEGGQKQISQTLQSGVLNENECLEIIQNELLSGNKSYQDKGLLLYTHKKDWQIYIKLVSLDEDKFKLQNDELHQSIFRSRRIPSDTKEGEVDEISNHIRDIIVSCYPSVSFQHNNDRSLKKQLDEIEEILIQQNKNFLFSLGEDTESSYIDCRKAKSMVQQSSPYSQDNITCQHFGISGSSLVDESPKTEIVGVLADGHGGDETSKMCVGHIKEYMKKVREAQKKAD